MHINATVFIQAMNFGITYLFLKKVLFKPVVQRIKQKETAKTMLLGTIKEKDALLLNLQNEKTEKLQTFRKSAQKFYTIEVASEQEIPATIAYKKDAILQERLLKQTKELLLKRVPHAF